MAELKFLHMQSKLNAGRSSGFTLLEILVVLVLLGLLIGAIVPNIIAQAGKGEINRIVRDMGTVEEAAKSFRVDVTRWPGDLDDLQRTPSTTGDADIHGVSYPQGLINRWSGPYLESVELVGGGTAADSVSTAAGGHFKGFTKGDSGNGYQLNGLNYLVLTLSGLSDAQLNSLDQEIDGSLGPAAGRLRTASSTAYYLAAPLQ